MYIMPSTPETCSSMGAATTSRTVWALAPGYSAVTCTVGGVTSGYCATGSASSATPPAITNTIDSTEAKIGRSMKKCEITAAPSPWGPSPCRQPGADPALDFHTRQPRQQPHAPARHGTPRHGQVAQQGQRI